ncbi:MAG: TIGR03617 family F420-dependent LLM class oxidoreductase [Acidimicrobiales bacterium]
MTANRSQEAVVGPRPDGAPAPGRPAGGPGPRLSAFGAGSSLRATAELAGRLEAAGFDRLWLPESTQDVFGLCGAAALATSELALGTGVAVAFARSPMLTAQNAWALARATGGRFTVGLGTQVRAHVERRYSAPFARPGPRLRDYIGAMRAIYSAFRQVAPLRYDGPFYSFSLLPPLWSPGPMEHRDPPIYAAGVRPWMCRMVGEVADGMLVHPLSSPAYLRSVVLPSVREGERAAGRPPGTVAIVCPVMTAVADDHDDERLSRQRDDVATRLAFYGSTPGYDVVFESSGWSGVGERLHRLQRDGDVAGMRRTITDEMLDAFAVTSTWDELPGRLLERFGDVADDIVCYSVVDRWDDDPDAADRWREVTRRFGELRARRS